jgi:hypothetical protein
MGDNMDITTIAKGTLFQLFGDTFVTESTHYYSSLHGIHMIKAHNIDTGESVELGMVAMFGANPIKPQES